MRDRRALVGEQFMGKASGKQCVQLQLAAPQNAPLCRLAWACWVSVGHIPAPREHQQRQNTHFTMDIVSVSSSSTSSASSQSTSQPPSATSKRRQKRRRQWKLQQVFPSATEATDYLNQESRWSLSYSNQTKSGTKRYYRCKTVKQRGVQCDAAVYLLLGDTTPQVRLFQTENGHTCGDASSGRGLSAEAKAEIERAYSLKLKPRRIAELLKEKAIHVKSTSQVNSFLQQLRHKHRSSNVSVAQLEWWFQEHRDKLAKNLSKSR